MPTGSGTPCIHGQKSRIERIRYDKAPVQKPKPHRDQVRQAQILAPRCYPPRSMHDRLPLRDRPRGYRALLAMSPETKKINVDGGLS